jgi:hypothetical protein
MAIYDPSTDHLPRRPHRDPGDPRRPAPGARHRRRHAADLPELDLRPEGPRRAQRLRVQPHPQPHPLRPRARRRGARGRQRWGLAFGSGLAATTTVMQLLSAGDHVIAGDDMYGGTFRLFDKVLRRRGHEFSYVDATDARRRRGRDPRPTPSLVWLETPTNPMLKIADIRAIAARCARAACCSRSTTPSCRRSSSARSSSAPTSSCTAPPSTSAATPTSSAASSSAATRRPPRAPRLPAERRRRGARARGLLPDAARAQDPPAAHASGTRERRPRRRLAREHPEVERVTTPASSHPQHALASRADVGLRRHDLVRTRGRPRGRAPKFLRPSTRVHPRREPRRRREPDRAPRDHDPRLRARERTAARSASPTASSASASASSTSTT